MDAEFQGTNVDLRFERRDVWELCNSSAAMMRRWGSDEAALLKQRLHEIDAAYSLADLAALPYIRIKNHSDGCLAVSACAGVRLLLRPGPVAECSGAEADWDSVREVTLVDVVDDRPTQE